MKVSSTIVWASTAYTVSAAANEAYVCTSDKTHPSSDSPRIISPGTARLAFAQRLGLSQYHDIGDAEDQVFEVLNELPGVRPQLFTDEEPEPFPRVLTIINDVQDPRGKLRNIIFH